MANTEAKAARELKAQREQHLEEMRFQVTEAELRARFCEAQYKMRHFTISSDNLNEEYGVIMAREEAAAKEAAIQRMSEQLQAAGLGVVGETDPGVAPDSIVPQTTEGEIKD